MLKISWLIVYWHNSLNVTSSWDIHWHYILTLLHNIFIGITKCLYIIIIYSYTNVFNYHMIFFIGTTWLSNLFKGIINIEWSMATNIMQTTILYNTNSSSPLNNGLSHHKPLCDSTLSADAVKRATILKFGNKFTCRMPKQRKNIHPTGEVLN